MDNGNKILDQTYLFGLSEGRDPEKVPDELGVQQLLGGEGDNGLFLIRHELGGGP